MNRPLRVLVADDHAPTRAGVRLVLEHGGCEVCAEAATADAAITGAIRERPDVCVLDVEMPGSGIRAAAEIASHVPDAAILMLTVSGSANDLFDSLRAGAAGYLLKDMDPDELVGAVRAAADGEGTLPGVLTARLIEEFRGRGGRGALTLNNGRTVNLTSREWDVLELVAGDVATAEIARRLFLSPVTVRRHVSILMRKLGTGSRDEMRQLVAGRVPTARSST